MKTPLDPTRYDEDDDKPPRKPRSKGHRRNGVKGFGALAKVWLAAYGAPADRRMVEADERDGGKNRLGHDENMSSLARAGGISKKPYLGKFSATAVARRRF
jgi:hypothetical protein